MRPGGNGLFFDGNSWICECAEDYFGTSCDCPLNGVTRFYNTTTSTCQEKTSYTIINGKALHQDSDGWILLLAYNHNNGENNALVSKTAPISPFQGYSHIWLEDFGLTANDVDGVKFFCNTSAHARVVHFSMNNEWIKSAIVTGSTSGNAVSYWTSGTTKFSDHTGILPDATISLGSTTFFEFPFVKSPYHWSIGGASRWECDDYSRNTANTSHQIWFKQKSTTSSSSSSSPSYRSPDYPKTAIEWDHLSIPPKVSGTTQIAYSWSDINQVCLDKGYVLCLSQNFCTDRVPPSAIDIPDNDSWIAVGDSENEWFTFRRGWGDRICKTHTEVAGSKPTWGTSTVTYTSGGGDMYRAGLCCSAG